MQRTTRRRSAAATSLVLAAGLALTTGACTLAAPAQAAGATQARADGRLTDFGYRGDVYGVKLVTDSVEALNLKDAHAQQLCTRAVGQVVEQQSAVSVPDNPLIHVSASTSRTETYADGSTHGVRGTSTIGDISIGGTVGPLTTPRLVIKGLQTTANAFNTPQGYGHAEGFTFASISLELLDNTVVQSLPPELQQLLGAARPGHRHRLHRHPAGRPAGLPGAQRRHRADRDPRSRQHRARLQERPRQQPATPSRRPRRCGSRSPPATAASSSSSAPRASGWAARPRSACSAPAAPRWTTRRWRAH